ncbi:MAG: hypothetical protein ACJZ5B_05095 [Candidatus Poseidoniaceae archaeon]
MVVMLSWESKKIGYTGLLKATIKLAKKAVKSANISLEDIGLIVHGGVFREHFRTEPAFATHIQGGLDIHCNGISFDSQACFSFDVTDGSCSPHVALQSIADLLPLLDKKYALLCIGDDRPTKHCEWNYESYCIVAVIGQSGDGPQLISVTHDSSKLNIDSIITGYFDEKIKANRFTKSGTVGVQETDSSENYFSGDQRWLSGKHMYEFLEKINGQNHTLEHCIVDRSGKSTTAKWEF